MFYVFGEGYLLFLNVLTTTFTQTDGTDYRKTKTREFWTKAQFIWFLVLGTRPRIMIYGNWLRKFSQTIKYFIFHSFNICLIRYSKPSFLPSWYSKAKNPWLRFYYQFFVVIEMKLFVTFIASTINLHIQWNGYMALACTTQLKILVIWPYHKFCRLLKFSCLCLVPKRTVPWH